MSRPAIHPGEIVHDELRYLELSSTAAASAIGISTRQLASLLDGSIAVSPAIAAKLGRWIGTGPEIWLNLQRQYEERRAAFGEGTPDV